jgi:hypothetical protein
LKALILKISTKTTTKRPPRRGKSTKDQDNNKMLIKSNFFSHLNYRAGAIRAYFPDQPRRAFEETNYNSKKIAKSRTFSNADDETEEQRRECISRKLPPPRKGHQK